MSDFDIDVASRLSGCVPLDTLSRDHLKALVRLARIERLKSGEMVFRRGETDQDAIFLVSGRVDLTCPTEAMRSVVAGGERGRYALSHVKPRQHDATVNGGAIIVRVDNSVLDRLLTLYQLSSYEVVEFDSQNSDPDFLFHLLQTPLFQRLPAFVIQQVLQQFETVEVAAGQTIISAGEPADYFYLIRAGRCEVWRTPPGRMNEVLVAELGEGRGFGEEALLSYAPRNATVRMRTGGQLLRLARSGFDQLLRTSLVRWVEPANVGELVATGTVLLDVRLESEFRSGAIAGSVNIPLPELRDRADTLDRKRSYLACCDTGNRGCAAAFLLSERGFDVSALTGGIGALRKLGLDARN